MEHFPDAPSLLAAYAPDGPVHCYRPHAARRAAERFLDGFPGEVFYAVKANPHPLILDALWQAGVRAFDVASPSEIGSLRDQFPEAELAFMHPVKSRFAIDYAWQQGVRIFAVDHLDELNKVLQIVAEPEEVTLVVRLAVPDGSSGIRLDGKFGASGPDAAQLLLAARHAVPRLGVSFHVGSQAMRPDAWARAMDVVSNVICDAAVMVDVVDVGGGFPVHYPDRRPAALSAPLGAIARAWEEMLVPETCALWAEPGRALCAEAGSVLARVELRKDGALYLNDGTYGGLFDAGSALGFRYPARLVRADAPTRLSPFRLFGPTCDGLDCLRGAYWLPEDVAEGDWIELGMLGAYSRTLRTRFNGFGACADAVLEDEPFLLAPTMEVAEAIAEENHP